MRSSQPPLTLQLGYLSFFVVSVRPPHSPQPPLVSLHVEKRSGSPVSRLRSRFPSETRRVAPSYPKFLALTHTSSPHPARLTRIWTQHFPTDSGFFSLITHNVSPSRSLSAAHKCPTFSTQISRSPQRSCLLIRLLHYATLLSLHPSHSHSSLNKSQPILGCVY